MALVRLFRIGLALWGYLFRLPACLHDGTEVIVKVRCCGRGRQVAQDLRLLGLAGCTFQRLLFFSRSGRF